MTTHVEAVEAIESALTDAGLRVATTAADVSPPVVYLRLWGDDEHDVLAGGYVVTVAVHYIAVRGTEDAMADAMAADQVMGALTPIAAVSPLVQTTVSVGGANVWPCLRWEATVQ